MSRSVSSNFISDVFAQQTDTAFIYLITITHPSLTDPIRVTNDPFEDLITNAGVRGVISNSVEYVAFPFEIFLQEQTDNLLAKAKLRIDNISREIMLAIRTVSGEPPRVNIKIVLSSDVDTVEFEVPNLRFNNIVADAFTVEGDLTPVIIQSEKYPYQSFNQADFPGVFGGV